MRRGYLFTDIEGSLPLWERAGEAMDAAMARHDRILDEIIPMHGGRIHDRAGDGVFAIFEAGNPLHCALALQLAFEREHWRGLEGLRIRVGVHAGAKDQSANARISERISINRAQRIMASGWGGQIVVSAEAIAAFALPPGGRLEDLGACHLKGVDESLRLFGLLHDDLRRKHFPPLRTLEAAQNNVPLAQGPLFGREAALQSLAHMIDTGQEGRLIWVSGPAGSGKSRLVQEAARHAGARAPVHYLAIETEEAHVDLLTLISRALSVPSPTEEPSALYDLLRARRRVIVLDNMERACGQEAGLKALLSLCPLLVIVCAARTPLHGHEGAKLRLEGLATPQAGVDQVAQSAAFRLFDREAARAGVDLALDADASEAFRRLCAKVAGLPLALQLTAAWLRYLTLDEIVVRLERQDEPAARELAQIFEESWGYLDASLQQALMRLGVFAAPFSVREAQEIAGVALADIKALEDHGLMERAGERRFGLHPLLQDFAARKLAEASELGRCARAAHAKHFLSPASLRPRRRGEAGPSFADLMCAWRFAFQDWPLAALIEAGERLFYWCAFSGHFAQGVELFDVTRAQEARSSYALSLYANCLVHVGQMAQAEPIARATCSSAEPLTRAHAIQALANIAHVRGDFDEALDLYTTALGLRSGAGDTLGAHYSATAIAALKLARGDTPGASLALGEAIACAKRGAHAIGGFHAHYFAGEIARAEGRLEDAIYNFDVALKLDADMHHPPLRATLLQKMGALAAEQGDLAKAQRVFEEARAFSEERGDQRNWTHASVHLGLLLLRLGDAQAAKGELLSALRTALKLQSKPLVAHAMVALMRSEIALDNLPGAHRIEEVLREAELGALEAEFLVAQREFEQKSPKRAGQFHADDKAAPRREILPAAERLVLRL